MQTRRKPTEPWSRLHLPGHREAETTPERIRAYRLHGLSVEMIAKGLGITTDEVRKTLRVSRPGRPMPMTQGEKAQLENAEKAAWGCTA